MQYSDFLKLHLMREDYIVIICLRYENENEWRETVEILEYDPTSDVHYWLSDWNEGEQNIEVLSAVPLSYIRPDDFGGKIITEEITN